MMFCHKDARVTSNINSDIKLTKIALAQTKAEPKQLEVVVWLERLCKELKQHIRAS